MLQSRLFTYDSIATQPAEVEEKSSFGYSCRPTTQKRSPFDRLGGI